MRARVRNRPRPPRLRPGQELRLLARASHDCLGGLPRGTAHKNNAWTRRRKTSPRTARSGPRSAARRDSTRASTARRWWWSSSPMASGSHLQLRCAQRLPQTIDDAIKEHHRQFFDAAEQLHPDDLHE
eukprot:6116477-Pyramimonas_sp.AAC.1